MKTSLDIIKKYGGNVFAIYCYIADLSKEKYIHFSIMGLCDSLKISKPTMIKSIKILKENNFIKVKKRFEIDKRILFIKNIGQNFLPIIFNSQNFLPINTNRNSDKKQRNNKIKDKKEEKKVLYPIYNINSNDINNKKLKKIYYKIIEKVLSFKRYDNEYYRTKKFYFRDKEKNHLVNLLENVNNVNDYVEWWIKEKASRMPGFSFGLLACTPMIEEYRIKYKHQKITKDEKKSISDNQKNRIYEIKLRSAKDAIEEYNLKEGKVDKITNEFIDKMIKEKIIKQKGKTLELTNDIE